MSVSNGCLPVLFIYLRVIDITTSVVCMGVGVRSGCWAGRSVGGSLAGYSAVRGSSRCGIPNKVPLHVNRAIGAVTDLPVSW